MLAAAAQAANHWSTLIVLVGVPANIVGAEVGSRGGRLRLVRRVALASAAIGVGCGFATAAPFALVVVLLLVYNVFVAADSGALTTGAVAASRAGEQGATLAVNSILGFVGASFGPLAVGLVLDAAGGLGSDAAWHWLRRDGRGFRDDGRRDGDGQRSSRIMNT